MDDRKIVGLEGEYCPACTQTLINFGLARFSIIAMCVYDLEQLLQNGDMQRIERMMDEKENQKCLDPAKLN